MATREAPTSDDALERRGLVSHTFASNYLDVSPATLHAWNHKGSGPRSYRVGKHRKYRVSDLDLWLEGRASAPRVGS